MILYTEGVLQPSKVLVWPGPLDVQVWNFLEGHKQKEKSWSHNTSESKKELWDNLIYERLKKLFQENITVIISQTARRSMKT